MNKKQEHKETLDAIQSILHECQTLLSSAKRMVKEMEGGEDEGATEGVQRDAREVEGEVIEGVFNGHEMEVPEGKTYPVPENYASKSRLVEGDQLKLTITREGRFIFKQIGPVPRATLHGFLHYAREEDQYSVLAEGRSYKVLAAPVAYFKGEVGDAVCIIVPEGRECAWAAVEEIFKNKAHNNGEEPTLPSSRQGGLEEI